jgi:hypothetical protein
VDCGRIVTAAAPRRPDRGRHALAAGSLAVFVGATGGVIALAFAGAASTGLMATVNFSISSGFRWMLLALAGLWVVATAAGMWP